MTEYIFKNNAKGKLLNDVGGEASTIQLQSGEGTLFPNPSAGQAFWIHVKGSDEAWMLCTSRSSDVLTVTRTDSYSFAAGAVVKQAINADILESFFQKGTEREVAGNPETLETVAAYFGEEVFNTVDETWYKDCDGTWKLMNGEGA